MTFEMMKFLGQYRNAVILTGDGDFAPIIEYLMEKKDSVKVIANGSRTAKELKKIVGDQFIDLRSLKEIIEFKNKSRTR